MLPGDTILSNSALVFQTLELFLSQTYFVEQTLLHSQQSLFLILIYQIVIPISAQ